MLLIDIRYFHHHSKTHSHNRQRHPKHERKGLPLFSVLRDLGWFFRREKRRYSIGLILLIVVGVLELLPPRLLGNAIDEIVRGSITTGSLLKYIGAIIVMMLIIYWITYVWMHKLFGGSNLVERLLRSRFMNHLMTMTPSFFEKTAPAISWPAPPMTSVPWQPLSASGC